MTSKYNRWPDKAGPPRRHFGRAVDRSIAQWCDFTYRMAWTHGSLCVLTDKGTSVESDGEGECCAVHVVHRQEVVHGEQQGLQDREDFAPIPMIRDHSITQSLGQNSWHFGNPLETILQFNQINKYIAKEIIIAMVSHDTLREFSESPSTTYHLKHKSSLET